MATIDLYQFSPEAFTEDMWREYAGSWRSGGESVFNKRSGEASLVGMVPSIALKAAMRFMLGYEQVLQATVALPGNFGEALTGLRYVLRRKNPIRHPYYENLWCTGCGELEFAPIRRGSLFAAKGGLKLPTKVPPAKTPAALSFRTGYNQVKLMLRFGPLPYDVLEDDSADFPNLSDQRAEWARNVVVDLEPRVETLETKIVYKFAEGTGLPAGYSNPLGTDILAERAQVLVKPDVVFRWSDVPAAYIMMPGTQIPANILAALGTLNAGFFLGFTRGTLLLTGAKLTRNPWALRAPPDLDTIGLESKFLYDIELMASFFDPVKGFTGTPAVQITTDRGHNNFPYRGNVGPILGAADKSGGRWLLATTTGTTDGGKLYKYTPFQSAFDSPLNGVTVPSDG